MIKSMNVFVNLGIKHFIFKKVGYIGDFSEIELRMGCLKEILLHYIGKLIIFIGMMTDLTILIWKT